MTRARRALAAIVTVAAVVVTAEKKVLKCARIKSIGTPIPPCQIHLPLPLNVVLKHRAQHRLRAR